MAGEGGSDLRAKAIGEGERLAAGSGLRAKAIGEGEQRQLAEAVDHRQQGRDVSCVLIGITI